MEVLRIGQQGINPIATVIEDWLRQEVINSDSGRNAILSDFDTRIADFYLPFDAPGNQMAAKAKGHFDRMRVLAEVYRDPSLWVHDGVTAKLIHHTLMEVSGSFRKQCYFEAATDADYRERRHDQGPAGIDLRAAVERGIAGPHGRISTLDEVIDATLEANHSSLTLMRSLHEWVADSEPNKLPLAAGHAEPIRAMQDVQRLWTGITAAHIVVAAELRGGIEQVPFLEAKSITDVSPHPHYPFAA